MLHNLLPPLEKKAIRLEYRMRFGTVLLVLLVGSVGVGVVTLLPTYIALRAEVDTIRTSFEGSVAHATSGVAYVQEKQESIQALKHTMGIFEGLYEEEQLTQLLTNALTVRPEAIMIGGVVYDRTAHTLVLEGVSATRDALVTYARTLEETVVFGRVPVSISDLAKNTDIRFRLVLPIE
jgi:Tfp pilus assembly protein PilN